MNALCNEINRLEAAGSITEAEAAELRHLVMATQAGWFEDGFRAGSKKDKPKTEEVV